MTHRRVTLVILVCLFLASASPSVASPASQIQANQAPTPPPEGPVVVRIPYADGAEKAAWASRYVLLDAPPGAGYVVAVLTPAELADLQASGTAYTLDVRRTEQLQSPPGYPCYRTPDEIEADLFAYQADYPSLAQVSDIGDSWEKTQPGGKPGYDIWMIKLTNQAVPGPKPAFFLMGNIHAIEMAAAEAAMAYADWLLTNYGTDADATWLLDWREVYIVPMSNPDGRMIAEDGSYWRKNTDNDDGCDVPSSWGTDVNRNFDTNWGGPGSSPNPCSGLYHGPAAESEPETQAIADALRAIFPNPADATGSMITLHQSGHYVVWPWGNGYSDPPWNMIPPDKPGLSALADKYVSYNGYTSIMGDDWYAAAGATEDWAYEELNIAGYTFEMGTSQPSSCAELATEIALNLPAFIYAAKSAGPDPYAVTRGPDALEPSVSPGAVPPGMPLTLSATGDDTHTGWLPDPDFPEIEPDRGRPVAAAEYYLDLPPWAGGTPHAMQPTDGAFDEVVEPVEANVDTTGLAPGPHLLLVRIQDDKGHWGAFSGALFWVSDGAEGTLSGTVTDLETGEPLAATVSVEPLGWSTETDPATGSYSLNLPPGTYEVTAVSLGYVAESQAGVEIVAGEITTVDFGLSPVACLLLVDDDQDDPDVRSYYTDALDQLGTDYDVWDSALQGSPGAMDLAGYQMAFWFTGRPWAGTFTSADEASVANYLDGDGRFFLSSQDYLYEMGLTPFGQTYLHIGAYDDDVAQTTVSGQGVFSGMGPYGLSYPYANYSDVVSPDAQAQLGFLGDQGDAAITYAGDGFHSVFLGFSLEAVPSVGDRAAVLAAAVDWFGGCQEPLPTVFVGNIKTKYRVRDPGPPTIYKVLGRVPVFDEALQPVIGATVTAQWELPGGQIKVKTATTRPNGSAYFKQTSLQEGLYVIRVLDVQAAGYAYDPNQNYETSEELLVP